MDEAFERELEQWLADAMADATPVAAPVEPEEPEPPADGVKPAQSPYWRTLLSGLWRENPTLRLVLGTCPTLAVTTTALGGLGMGAAATFVLLCSNVVVSLLRRLIPGRVRLPAYMIVIAGFTTVVQLLVKAFLPAVDAALGIFLPLIVVNCIILARAEAFAGKNPVGLSALDGIGMGAGFTGALLAMGLTRELLGAGTVFGLKLGLPAIGFFALPAGGFFVFGTLIWLTGRIGARFEASPSPVREAGCGGCPLMEHCGIAADGKGAAADA